MTNKFFLVLGTPGTGKNVIAEHIAHRLGIAHVNYRSIMIEAARNEAAGAEAASLRDSPVPFPPDRAYFFLEQHLRDVGIESFVLDGYPKSASEARLLRSLTARHGALTVLHVTSPDEVTSTRLLNRLVCPTCNYVLYDPQPNSILETQCSNCHVPLMKRQDDDEQGIAQRISRHRQEIEGVIEVLQSFAEVHEIDGTGALSEVISDSMDILLADLGANEKLAERGARLLVEGLGLNLADPNMIGTPSRIVKSLRGLMVGQYVGAQARIKKDLAAVFPTHYKGMIILEPVNCVSLCSHHLLPVQYQVYFGYLAADKSLGFSKIVKVINTIAAKPALQEDFTQEVIEVFNKVLQPQGIMVVVKGVHTCMSMRGERSQNTNTTSAVRGIFKTEQAVREEFLLLSGVGK